MSDSDKTISEQPPQQKEIRSKRRSDHTVVGSNAPLNSTQESSAFAGLPDPDNVSLADALKNLRKRKKEAVEIRKPKKRSVKGNEADETMHEVLRSASEAVAGSSNRTRMFDSFDTVSLGRDDISATQPSQPSKPRNDNLETVVEVQHGEGEVHETEADEEVHHAEVVLPTETAINTETVAEKENQDESTILEMPKQQPPPVNAPVMQDIVEEEHQHEPLTVIMPEREGPLPEGPEPYSLTLREWLQPEAEGCAAKDLTDSPNAIITDVLLSINRGGLGSSAQPTNDDNQDLGDQCRTPDPLQQQEPTAEDLQARCTAWATLNNDNKYDTIFQLRGPRTIEAMRYNFMTTRPATCIDIQMVSIMCHVLNRERVERFERDVYCVPPEILTRMFDTYGLNYLDKKTKMPYLVKQLKDHKEYVQLLDMEKLKSHSVHKEFYIVDSVYGIAPNQNRNKLHQFALRCVDVPKQPNPTDCGLYVMKWMELLDAATLLGCYQYKFRYDLEEWGQDRLDGFRAEIVAKLILSDENTLRVEAMTQAKKMGRQVRPSAALKSPYVQVSTAELDKKR
ncbi:hypothetical protein PIB30_042340 [Stylosanthes scabra]|uniref:Ubiquitin-like protease family profile domain-containing protein n=1 Tax=Stylosanthes scabra TaxID=79078 RepID=A0ABU6SF44_9FABA|nr:hypothetical protein [Stylosanthes scabra]